ncbi:GNAT family N-acetyltransferase [Clostridium sp.]|uniref:GNAT family N-acetyltransferase n=1 Tax=Clostridium sp. TaxID=1506 RepID=UPI003216A175
MKFRKADIKDIDELFILFKELMTLHGKEVSNIFKVEIEESMVRNYISDIISKENYNLYVAENEKIIGVIEVINIMEENKMHKNRKYALIDKLVIDEGYRGLGIGNKLIEYAEKEIKSMGIDEVELYVWEFNEGALNLYEKKGYKSICRRMSRTI